MIIICWLSVVIGTSDLIFIGLQLTYMCNFFCPPCAAFLGAPIITRAAEVHLDVNSYLRYSGSTSPLQGAENLLRFKFRFCSNHGMLLYQEDGDKFFALGVNAGKVYLEWKTSDRLIEVCTNLLWPDFHDVMN